MLNELAVNGVHPDLTIVFDIDTETSMARVGAEKDRLESAGIEFHKRVRNGYLEIAKKNPQRIKVVDASQTIEDVQRDVIKIIEGVL